MRPADRGYLSAMCPFGEVKRGYRQAMLKIHPDKHMQHWDKHIRATEMFKEVTLRYNAVRDREA